MTLKEKLLKIDTFEEYDKRRLEFKELELDIDIWNHISQLNKKHREALGIKTRLSDEPDVVSDPTPIPKSLTELPGM